MEYSDQPHPCARLCDLISPQSWFLFHLLGCSGDWLELPVVQWRASGEFQNMNEFVRHVEVVNDSAERAVKLIHAFSFRTEDEGQKQFLLNIQLILG